jgi:hypothetical protein
MTLLFLNKVSQAFANKVKQVADALSTEANWLMFAMGFETGYTFSPSIQNGDSQATGLIQFLPSTAVWLGTTVEALKAMSAEDQLYWVQKYLEHRKKQYGPFASYHDLYFAIFYPYAISQPDSYIIGSEDDSQEVQKIAMQNKGFDLNKNNAITKLEVKQWLDEKVRKNFPEAYWPEFFKKKTFCSSIKGKSLLAA